MVNSTNFIQRLKISFKHVAVVKHLLIFSQKVLKLRSYYGLRSNKYTEKAIFFRYKFNKSKKHQS